MSAKPRPKARVGDLRPAASEELLRGFTSFERHDALLEVPLDQLTLRKNQPRRQFSAQALHSLTASIKAHGVLQPISVHALGEGRYEVIAGERRVRGAREAGLSKVPAKLYQHLSEAQIKTLAAVENLQREDLNPVDEVDAILDILGAELKRERDALLRALERWRRLALRDPELARADEQDKGDIERLGEAFARLSRGEWTSFVSNRLPVLRLPLDLLDAVRYEQLDYTKALLLRRLGDEEQRRQLTEVARGASVQTVRRMVKQATGGAVPEPRHTVAAGELKRVSGLLDESRWAKLGRRKQAKIVRLIGELDEVLR